MKDEFLKPRERFFKPTEGALKSMEGALKSTEGVFKPAEGALKPAERTRRDKWTREEDATLGRTYPRAPWESVLAALPGRTRGSVMHRAMVLGIRRERREREEAQRKAPLPSPREEPKWKADEIRALLRLYPGGSPEALAAAIPGRSAESIERKARAIGIRRKGGAPSPSAPAAEAGKSRAAWAGKSRAGTACAGRGTPDPSSRCGECLHYRVVRGDGGCNSGVCGCWKVRGEDGDYLRTGPSGPSCRHFVPGRACAWATRKPGC